MSSSLSLLESLANNFSHQRDERDAFISGAVCASFLWLVTVSIFWGCMVSTSTPPNSNRATKGIEEHRRCYAKDQNESRLRNKLQKNSYENSNESNNPWKTKEAIEHRRMLERKEVSNGEINNEAPIENERENSERDKKKKFRHGVLKQSGNRNSFTFSIIKTIQMEKERLQQSLSSQIRERWPWEESLHSSVSKSILSSKNEGENDYIIPTAFDSKIMKEENHFTDEDDSTNNGQDRNSPKNQSKVHDEETKSDTCIGSIFGLDCGGTLSKLLYFEHKPKHQRRSKSDLVESGSKINDQTVKNNTDTCGNNKNHDDDDDDRTKDNDDEDEFEFKMNRSHSMFEIASNKEEHQQALDRFYNFVTQLDTYGPKLKDKASSFYSRTLGGEFHFIQFQTQYITRAMDLIKVNNLHHNINQLGATGGGAHKYANKWDEELQITIAKQDELDSLVAGMQFILADVVGECYTFKPNEEERLKDERQKQNKDKSQKENNVQTASKEDQNKDTRSEKESKKNSSSLDPYWWSKKVTRDYVAKTNSYPYLLVMIGTGVSVLRVDGPRKHERISGSTIGGGTYWGLCRLLTDAEDFESVLALAEQGDPSKVDMMVGDIYGENSDALKKLGLAADVVASSFGKLVAKQHPARGLTQGDLARALLLMVTINIGQVALLNARLCKTSRIFFVGNFLRQNVLSMKRLAFAIHYWSRGTMEALFLEHEGYFGALGAFLLENGIPQPQSSQSTIPTVNSETLMRKSRSGSF